MIIKNLSVLNNRDSEPEKDKNEKKEKKKISEYVNTNLGIVNFKKYLI